MLIRAATVEDAWGLAKVHVDTWKAAYRGILRDSYLDGLAYDRSARGWEETFAFPGNHVFLAEDEHRTVVGFASGGPSRDADNSYGAELYAIYILPEQQHRGIGRSLLRRFAEAIALDGFDSLITWVLAANVPARRFYEAMQGVVSCEREIQIAGQSLAEVAYGWPEIHVLASASSTPNSS